jgi:hypothetical protein
MARMKINVDQLPLIPKTGAIIINNSGKTHPAIIIIMFFHFIFYTSDGF